MMQFAAVQFDIAWQDKPANHAVIERMIDEAEPAIEPGAFVLLPELGDTGFSFDLDAIVDNQTVQWACRVARQRKIWLQPGFAERAADGRGRNCAAIIDPRGELRGVYRKVHPFSYGKEIEFFDGGDELLIHPCNSFNVSPLICYDLRFPELWRLGAINGTDVFTIGASWPAARQAHWRNLLIARAVENQAYVVAVNRIGKDPKIEYVGGSMIISPMGDVIVEAADEAVVLQAELDVEPLAAWRRKFPALRDIRKELLGHVRIKRESTAARSVAGEPESA